MLIEKNWSYFVMFLMSTSNLVHIEDWIKNLFSKGLVCWIWDSFVLLITSQENKGIIQGLGKNRVLVFPSADILGVDL